MLSAICLEVRSLLLYFLLFPQTAGVVQNIYQATAAKEAAEQSGIKTLHDAVELSKLK